MKLFHTTAGVSLSLAAFLWGASSAHAFPMRLALPVAQPASLSMIGPPPEMMPANPVPLSPSVWDQTSALWALNGAPLWSRDTDPSLRLTDWRHVFDICALGAFNVPLRDDPGERTNILLASAAVDNVTVAPGEEFSFNAQVGERTPERGYQDGLMFDQGRVIRGTGGGICLVATGLYNAALHAGLEITERHPHSGLVSYAPPGCDAGIVYGQEDLKFRNTTETPLVIRAQPVDDDHIAVRLYGHTPPPGRQVIVKPISLTTLPYAVVTKSDPALLPGQSVVDQKPRSGYEVVLGRFWTVQGLVVRREIVTQERRAPRNKILRVALPPSSASPIDSLIPPPGLPTGLQSVAF